MTSNNRSRGRLFCLPALSPPFFPSFLLVSLSDPSIIGILEEMWRNTLYRSILSLKNQERTKEGLEQALEKVL